jgi:hypothetical protein
LGDVSWLLQAVIKVQCDDICKFEKYGRKTKNLKELLNPGSLNGSPTDLENENYQRKAG